MELGKDFWFVIWLLKIIIEILERFSKDNNSDTPAGQV